MSKLIILHTNDIHGRFEGLARIVALIEQVRAETPGAVVLYFDGGDIEEPTVRISNVTKGAAMHRLLSAAGCAAAVTGNGGMIRYGPQVLADHAGAAQYPLLLANLRMSDGTVPPGVQPSAMIDLDFIRLGLIGISDDFDIYRSAFGMKILPALPIVRDLAVSLEQDGADAVILLSHMGLAKDRELAAGLQDLVSLIIGGHTHDLLPEGEQVGSVLIAQAGERAQHVGRIELDWDGSRLTVEKVAVLPVPEDSPASALILAEAKAVEAEVARFLDEIVGELAGPLDFAADRECGVANLMADILRERMGAEVAIVAAGQAITGPLPAGPLRRGDLWDACSSSANPGLVTMTGAQLTAMMERGLDPAFAAEMPRQLRGQPRGLLHLSGGCMHDGQLFVGGAPVEPERNYRVAGSDWELEPYGGYVDAAWGLQVTYEVPTILREAVEDYLAAHRPASTETGRLG